MLHSSASRPLPSRFLFAVLMVSLPQSADLRASQRPSLAPTDPPPSSSPTAGSARRLEPVKVHAYRALDQSQAANKNPTALLETPQSVSVVTREQMDVRGVQSVTEAVRYVAGVQSASAGNNPLMDEYSVRGFTSGSSSNDVLLDGMKAAAGGQWNRPSFDSWALERIEVLKGPAAVLYGQVAPGGVINLASKLPQTRPQRMTRLYGGSYQERGGALDVGGKITGNPLIYRLVGLYRDTHTQVDDTRLKRYLISPSLSWKISDSSQWTLLAQFQRDQGNPTFQFLPAIGTLHHGSAGWLPRSRFVGEPGWNTYNRSQASLGWMFEHRFNEHWTLQQSLRHARVASLYRGVVISGALGQEARIQRRRGQEGRGHADSDTLDTRVLGRIDTGPVHHQLLVGLDWQHTRWSAQRLLSAREPSPIDVYRPVPTGTDFAASMRTRINTRETDQQLGTYLQDQIAFDHWRLSLGTRRDRASLNARDRISHTDSRIPSHALTSRGGLLYLFDNGLAPYLSFSQSFQPPTSAANQSYDGLIFEPVIGRQYEAGIKYQPSAIDGLLTASVYDLLQRHILGTDPDPGHVCGTGNCMIQDGEGRIRGMELEGRLVLGSHWQILGNWTLMQSLMLKSRQGNEGKGLVGVPRQMASFRVDYDFKAGGLHGLALGAGLRHVASRWGDSANSLRMAAYTLIDASLALDLSRFGWRDARLTLSGSNLADRRYLATCRSEASCYYGTRRQVVARVHFQW